MDPPDRRRHPHKSDNDLIAGVIMRLVRRKPAGDDEAERCPRCRERLPDGAVECMMCGVALEPPRGVPRNGESKASRARRPAR
jgi:hypothetical protein